MSFDLYVVGKDDAIRVDMVTWHLDKQTFILSLRDSHDVGHAPSIKRIRRNLLKF